MINIFKRYKSGWFIKIYFDKNELQGIRYIVSNQGRIWNDYIRNNFAGLDSLEEVPCFYGAKIEDQQHTVRFFGKSNIYKEQKSPSISYR